MGEYLATAIGFQELGVRAKDDKATLLGDTLMNAGETQHQFVGR